MAITVQDADLANKQDFERLYRATRLAALASHVKAPTREGLQQDLDNGDYRPYIICDGARILGAALADIDSPYLRDFAIYKRHQGKGYGKPALEAVLKQIAIKGQPFQLDVGYDNMRAQHLYEQAGFKKEHEWKSTGNWHMKKDASHPVSENSIKTPEDLDNLYKKFKYRVLNQKTGRPYFNTNEDTFDNWQQLTVAQMLKHKIGICYDTAALNHYFLTKWGIPHENLFAYTKRSEDKDYDDDPTHTFTIYQDKDNKWRWLEGAWGPFKNNGWVFDNKDDLIAAIGQQLTNESGLDTRVGKIIDYPAAATSMDAFYNQAKEQAANNPLLDLKYKKQAKLLYHGSPDDIPVLSGSVTKASHNADGKAFLTPDKILAACFIINKQKILDRLEKQLGHRIENSNFSYDVWKMSPEERAVKDRITVGINVPGIKPFNGSATGYIYSADVPDDKLQQYNDSDINNEVVVEGDVPYQNKEKKKVLYRVQSSL